MMCNTNSTNDNASKMMINMAQLAMTFQDEIVCKTRMYRLRLFPNCFVGKEAVDLLVHLTGQSRAQARALGDILAKGEQKNDNGHQVVVSYCPFEHVCDPLAHPTLEDDYIFYRFGRHHHHHYHCTSKQRAIDNYWRNKGLRKLQNNDNDSDDSFDGASESDQASADHESSGERSIASSLMSNATTEEKMKYFERGIKVHDRKYRLRTYKNCFVGKEAVDFIVRSGMVADREAAVELGREWMREFNLFEHVLRQHEFKDQYLFYHFVSRRDRFAAMRNGTTLFALSALDEGIYLEDITTSSAVVSDAQPKSTIGDGSLGSNSTTHFYMSFNSSASSTPEAVFQEGQGQQQPETGQASYICQTSVVTHSSVGSDTDQGGSIKLHSLAEVAEAMELNIPVGHHKWRFRNYDSCFVAEDAVTYLVEAGYARDREAAVHLGKRVQRQLNLYHHVCEEHDFADAYYFFRFTPRDEQYEEPVMVELPLSQIADQFEQGVRVRSHTYRMKSFPNTFLGTDAVDFLVQTRLADSRRGAVRIGKALVEHHNLFVNVTGDVEFADEQFLFRFLPKGERMVRSPNPYLDGSIQKMSFEEDLEAEQEPPTDTAEPTFVFSPTALTKHKLLEIAESFRSAVKVKNNRWRGRAFPRTFIGADGVSYLVNAGLAHSRKVAVEIGCRLQEELKLFRHVTDDHMFKDDHLFYRFCDGENECSVNSSSGSTITGDHPACTARSLLPLETIAEMMQKGVKTHDRWYHLKLYRDCFVGREAVDFLVRSNLASSRIEAVDLGRILRREFNLFEHVVDATKPFHDEYLFYRFLNKGTNCDQSQLLFENMDISRLIALAICFEEGVEVNDNRIGFKVYPNTFFGSDAVDYVLQNFRFMVNSRHAAVHFVRRIASEFNLLELVTNEYEFKDCDKSLYFFTRAETRQRGMFFKRVSGKRQLMTKHNNSEYFWQSVCDVMGDIPRVTDFEILSDDVEWSKKLKDFEVKCSRRESFDNSFVQPEESEKATTVFEKTRRWATHFRQLDPRYQILTLFNQVAQEGAMEEDEKKRDNFLSKRPLLWYLPNRASVFTVWRPTSLDAIRRMMLGEAVGKGLDIKGKSAKRGKLSSFVPFLQISENLDKKAVRTRSKDGTIRVFYGKDARRSRDLAVEKLDAVAKEMMETVKMAQQILENERSSRPAFEDAYESMLLDMSDPEIRIIDDYAPQRFGFEVPERLLWEAYIVRQDITHKQGCEYCTGRPSQPAFQDLNLSALRGPSVNGRPRAVLYQNADPLDSPMNPFELLMAYEEHGRVLPVCSDFDSFLMGTRRVDFSSPMPEDQVEVLRWMISEIERVLDYQASKEQGNNNHGNNWTQRWIDVLRKATREGFHPEIPRYGFGDAKSYSIMKQATESVTMLSGAVRHGGECFNYYFPQELDEEFLVISDDLPGTNLQWKYADVAGLQDILLQKVDEGFTFPLNPKWVLADGPKWKQIYDKMLHSQHPNIKKSMDVWFPPKSGIREEIERISRKHPDGFVA